VHVAYSRAVEGRQVKPDDVFAHSLPTGDDTSRWEPLSVHLRAVAARAAQFAAPFNATHLAELQGMVHDIGKCSAENQAYFRGRRKKGPDHSTAGARVVASAYGRIGRVLAFGIAGHHSGLMDGAGHAGARRSLTERLDENGYRVPAYDRWREYVPELPTFENLRLDPRPTPHPDYPGFEVAFLTRMLFSCLVDADFLETERFYRLAEGLQPPPRGGTVTAGHLERIRAYMSQHRRDDTRVNRVRSEILDHAVGRAGLPPGLFTLTVPTGGGKTLTSLSFALEHALAHDLRRMVYVIPFTSIIEQTARVFREALATDTDILEHHSSFDWDTEAPGGRQNDDGIDDLSKLRRDAENWDAPIVVTTAVQFFESLFAARTSKARKLHNLAKSVIVLDEAQTIPVRLLRPCMAALDELARNYGASVVLCTATQPALRKCDAALPLKKKSTACGFDIDDSRELAPRPRELYNELKRVRVEWLTDPVSDEEIAARFALSDRMLCIVNSRRHARHLYDAIRQLPGACHLTTLMYARHRRAVLDDLRSKLARQLPVRLVATSLIEAGVDIDFPEVWRAATGLDSIGQAGGRCNREGRLAGGGRLVIFEAAGWKTPPAIKAFYQAARPILRAEDDPLSLESIHKYFHELYFEQGYAALDAARCGGQRFPIVSAIQSARRDFNFPFSRIAEAFRLIEDVMRPVIIPRSETSRTALRALKHASTPPVDALRTLQQYVVPVPRTTRASMLAAGAVQPVDEQKYGDRFVFLANESLYDEECGLGWEDPTWRASEANVI
jgi:CRISPR-associated endonuclease/helicase Cas3